MDATGPVAIGGVGGSGTRVIAAMVSGLGFQPGTDLNVPEDDLTFSILFKRPKLYRGLRGLIPADHASALAATRAFVALRTGHRLDPAVAPIVPASLGFPSSGVYPMPTEARQWALHRLRGAFRHPPPQAPGQWMWKEPNTLLFLPTLFREVAGLRYIHMVRNGLSMAKSKNNFQLTNWGYLFDTSAQDPRPELPKLVYWARVNLAVADFLADQPRSLVITHERTVSEPMAVLEEIAGFVGRPVTDPARAAAEGVRRPDDFERSFDVEHGEFRGSEGDDVQRALERFGYAR
jgi:hypothetical protein